MKKFPFSVKLVIFTLITTFIWISTDIYRTFSLKPSPTVADEILTPINPQIDTQTLDSLKERVYLIDEEIEDTLIVEEGEEEIVEEEIVEEETEATESAEVEEEV